MRSQSRVSQFDRFAPLDRFNAFSDGVIAIAITLLVLELPVPGPEVPMIPALLEEWAAFLGYFISFAFIGGVWIAHARLTRLMKDCDTVAYGTNLLLLLFVAMLPFATSLMVSNLGQTDVGTGVLIYGVVVLLASVTLTLLMIYVAREEELLVDDVADDVLRVIYRQRWVSIGVNAFALVLALFEPLFAVMLYLIQTLLLIVLPLLGLRKKRGAPQS